MIISLTDTVGGLPFSGTDYNNNLATIETAFADVADTTGPNTWSDPQTFSGGIIVGADSSFADGVDLTLGTTTGTRWGTAANQKQAFFGANPVVQPPLNEDMRTSFIGLGLIAGGVNPLNLNGGALAVGAAEFAGQVGGGSAGSAFAWKSATVTFPSDADYTLSVSERSARTLDVQAGTITVTRNIIVPGTVNGSYWVINRNAQSVVLKTAAGTGITIPSQRARLIQFPGGLNAFAMTDSQDYTV